MLISSEAALTLVTTIFVIPLRDPSIIDLDSIIGFILNIPSDYKFGVITLPLRRRHWIAVRRIGDSYYNLDSKLRQPELLGNEADMLQFLREQLSDELHQRELFLVLEQQSGENTDQRWIKPSYRKAVVWPEQRSVSSSQYMAYAEGIIKAQSKIYSVKSKSMNEFFHNLIINNEKGTTCIW